MTVLCRTVTGVAAVCERICYKGNTIFNKLCPEVESPNDVPWDYGWVAYYNHPEYYAPRISNRDLQTVKHAMYDPGWGNFTPKYPC